MPSNPRPAHFRRVSAGCGMDAACSMSSKLPEVGNDSDRRNLARGVPEASSWARKRPGRSHAPVYRARSLEIDLGGIFARVRRTGDASAAAA